MLGAAWCAVVPRIRLERRHRESAGVVELTMSRHTSRLSTWAVMATSVIRATSEFVETEFVCIPRPVEKDHRARWRTVALPGRILRGIAGRRRVHRRSRCGWWKATPRRLTRLHVRGKLPPRDGRSRRTESGRPPCADPSRTPGRLSTLRGETVVPNGDHAVAAGLDRGRDLLLAQEEVAHWRCSCSGRRPGRSACPSRSERSYRPEIRT